MSKPVLSTSDVAKLTADLYALPDSSIILEAGKVSADFNTWIKATFALTPEEIAYVDTFPLIANLFYGHLFAAAFLSRGPIIFPSIPDNPLPRRFKETRANLFGNVTFNNDDKELTGTMDVTIEFALL